jgi:hypothetical protein
MVLVDVRTLLAAPREHPSSSTCRHLSPRRSRKFTRAALPRNLGALVDGSHADYSYSLLRTGDLGKWINAVSLAPLDLVSAHPWKRVAFTTYALSLSFFEAVVLDALVRGRGAQALILADVWGVRQSIGEQGAQRVGKDYDVEPVSVSNGVFHPKISIFAADDDCHMLVGSGNLTFGGWGGSCEVLEHLHPSFAPDAIADAADFFDLIPTIGRIRQGVDDQFFAIASDLRRATQGKPRTGEIRLLHSLVDSIAVQIAQIVNDLGGAEKIVVAAPFWDDGSAIDDLCESIGLDHVFVHAHQHGCVEGRPTANWPRKTRTEVEAVQLAPLDAQGPRRLHAKVIEIQCRRGRLMVSGSANATTAGLGRDRNVETCVARIQRGRMVGWPHTPSEPLEPRPILDGDEEKDEPRSGVLRAVLDADVVTGEVMTPKMTGPVSIYCLSSLGHELLADVTLEPRGGFHFSAPGLEIHAWRGGRLVIRVQDQDGRRAEGFVSVASVTNIRSRAGYAARHLFAVLTGTETPVDISAIVSWFAEDPMRLTADDPVATLGWNAIRQRDDSEQLIPIGALATASEGVAVGITAGRSTTDNTWSRFLDHIMQAFRSKRGPFERARVGHTTQEDDENDESGGAEAELEDDARANANSTAGFEQLLELLTKPGVNQRAVITAFDLADYLCDRLRPEAAQARGWLERLVRALLRVGVPSQRRDDVIVAVLMLLSVSPDPSSYRWARESLLRLDVDFTGVAPSPDGAHGFQAVLTQQATFSDAWEQLREVRTYAEQLRSYQAALGRGEPSSDYPDLPSAAPEQWPLLQSAFVSARSRSLLHFIEAAVDVCPRCDMTLPKGESFKLQSIGIATAKNCCRHVLISLGA